MKITKHKLKEIIKEEIKNTYVIMQEADEETAQEFKRLVLSDPGAQGIWTAVQQVTRSGYKRKLLWDSIIKNPLDWNLATWTTLQKMNDFILNKHPSALIKLEIGVSQKTRGQLYKPSKLEEEKEKEYPNKSTMKKLILQAKRSKNPRKKVYKQTYNPDLVQLKKDFDELVRNTTRDPLKKYTSTKGDKDE